ncbi:MAG TPA: hypothetical protein ENN43_01895 [bacterium]|nr:hypothetical protein [bacterium]
MEKIIISVIFVVIFAILAGCGTSSIAPMELISRGLPAYTNENCESMKPPSAANSADYSEYWRSCSIPQKGASVWLAYDLSAVEEKKREKIIVVWYNDDTSPYDHTLITAQESPGYNNIRDYTIEANEAGGQDLPEEGWVKLVSVEGNTFHSRQHLLNLKGYNSIRINCTASDGSKDNMNVSFKMDVYDASTGGNDNWIFYGDSITQMSMHHRPFKCSLGEGSFSMLINGKKPGYFPLQENGGTGYMTSADGAKNIEKWLEIFPGRYVALGYGTNDAWSGMAPEDFYYNHEIMVKAVLKAGKVPLVPKNTLVINTAGNTGKRGKA